MRHQPKKRLGQNFLFDKNIQRKIIASCGLKKDDVILEIGAGRGELTQLIAPSVRRIYALEIDKNLCAVLEGNLAGFSNVKIVNQDILAFDLGKYFAKFKNKIKVIGNIPYYISTPIIERLLKYRGKIESVYLTVQKEFAERLAAPAGSKVYGSLSCFVQYYAQPQILFRIKKTSFTPRPKVDSCFLRLEIRSEPAVKVADEKLFFRIIRTAFNQRRKTLRNSLSGIIPAQNLEKFFTRSGIGRNIRPEQMSLENFAFLTEV